MSFNPAAADFFNSSLLTPANTLPMRAAVMSIKPTNKRMTTLKQTTDSLTAKLFRRPVTRARKARVRLRQQNKMRLAVVRNT
jgi:hypothetical protein